jgi:hypothetical protein
MPDDFVEMDDRGLVDGCYQTTYRYQGREIVSRWPEEEARKASFSAQKRWEFDSRILLENGVPVGTDVRKETWLSDPYWKLQVGEI